jgi:hypothetical protein
MARWILASWLILAAVPFFAQTVTVAVGNCQPKRTTFPTIQQALNATPPGAVIDVCPGPHPEQILVYQAVTLKGIASGNQGAAVITVPNGGLLQNATSLATGNPIAAQVLVQAASSVTITNITVDGANNGINGCGPNPIGIYYQNSSGTISHDTILNEVLGAGLTGCQAGDGIFVQSGNGGSSTVTINNNHVANYQKNGITGNELGTSVTITSNDVVGQGPTDGAAENSIQIGFGATGSITSNTVGSDVWAPDVFGDTGDAAAGILVYASPNVAIKSNNVSNTQFGIAIVSDPTLGAADGATLTSNTVSATHLYDGIDLCSNSNIVTTNTINGSDEAAIHVDDTCTGASTGNMVTKNKINSACAGILSGPASGNTTIPNTFYNAVTLQSTGTNTCTPPPGIPNKSGARSRARIRAARPKGTP